MTPRQTKVEIPRSTAQQLGSIVKSSRDIMRKDKGLSGDLDRLPMLTWIMLLKFLDDMEKVRQEEAKLAGKRFHQAIEPPYRWRDWASNPQGMSGPELIAFINQDEAVRPDGKRGAGLFAYLRALQSANGDRRDVIAKVFEGTVNRMINGYLLRDVVNKVNEIHFTSRDEIHTLGHLYESMLKEMRDAAGDSGEFYTPRALVKFIVAVVDPKLGETVLDPAAGTGGFLVEAFEHLKKQCKKAQDFSRLQEGTLYGIEPKHLPYLLCQMNLLLHGVEYPEIDPLNALRFPLREIGDRDRVDVIMTNPPFGGEEERGILSNFPEDKQTSETALLFLQLIMRKLRRQVRGFKGGRAAVILPESVMSDAGSAQLIREELLKSHNLHTVIRLPKGVFEPYSDIQTNVLFFDSSGPTRGIWFYEHQVPSERREMRNPCYTQTTPLKFDELSPLLEWWNQRRESPSTWYVPSEEIVARRFTLDFRNPASGSIEVADFVSLAGELGDSFESSRQIMPTLAESLARLKQERPRHLSRLRLSSFLTKVRQEADVLADKEYKQITVKLYGKGVVLRGTLQGVEIKTRPQFLARSGQLIMSRIDARNGAFGLVPSALDMALVTNDFPLFAIDSTTVLPEYLALILRSSEFVNVCKRSSRGTTNRKRLREELFLAEEINVPPLQVQQLAISSADLLTSCRARLGEMNASAEFLDSLVVDSLASAKAIA